VIPITQHLPPSRYVLFAGGIAGGKIRRSAMSFGLYLLGFIIVIAGLVWGGVQLGLATVWIAIGAVVLLGIGILTGVSRTRQKDPAE
jgi:hypothetical protein